MGACGWSKKAREVEDFCTKSLLSSEERDEMTAFRTGDGGSVGTVVVVVMVVIWPAFCLDSFVAWRAYLTRFARVWLEGRPGIAGGFAA